MAGLRRPRWPVAAAIAALLAVGAVAYGWETQSGYFALLPDPAHPAADAVHVPGGTPPKPGTGFYFVDVQELEANLLQEFWARHLVDGAELIPTRQVLAPGESYHQARIQDFHAMASSQEVAQVVAERALGKHVVVKHLGALIGSVIRRYPADRAGIRPGDVIVRAQGRPVRSAGDLLRATAGLAPGDRVTFRLARGRTVRLRTVADPQDKKRAIVGISIGDDVKIGRIPVRVSFSVPGIGGPSAGLAFALEIYDSLSGRRLLRGHRIAVTGELDLAGGVHEIGGATQKTYGAIDAHADTFLVPAGSNYQDARAAAHGHIHVIAVRSFRQALAAIRRLAPRSS